MRRPKKNGARFTNKRPRRHQQRNDDVEPRPLFETVEYGGEAWFVVDYTAGGAPIGLRVDGEDLELAQHSDRDPPF